MTKNYGARPHKELGEGGTSNYPDVIEIISVQVIMADNMRLRRALKKACMYLAEQTEVGANDTPEGWLHLFMEEE